jgi:hypothetical protein
MAKKDIAVYAALEKGYLDQKADEAGLCEGCEGDCGICDQRHNQDSRYQASKVSMD